MAAGLHATMVVAMVMAETANFRATLLFIVPSLLSLAAGRDALGERLHFRSSGKVFVERLGHELLSGTPVQGAGEAQFEVPVRIEAKGERRLGLAGHGARPRQRHHFGLRRGRLRRRLGRGLEAFPKRSLLLDDRRRL